MQPSEEIKSRLDIVDVIREYIPSLNAAGINFKTNCPFHQEKTPSFMVSPEKQIWHCFGCGEGGDIFSFVMKIEGISFSEALRLLAPKAGVVLTKQDPKLSSARNKLLDIMEASVQFYYENLQNNPLANGARQYLQERGLKEETIDDWLIGYSSDSWDDLINHLKSRGFKDNEIFSAGLSIKKEETNRYYNRFRGRIMFPIYDHNNAPIAFSARVSPEKEASEKLGKYINSPQTLIYDKSKVLFGLNRAKMAIKNENLAIVVEGQMDVITAHQHGFKNVVASSGTALSKEQLLLIKRYTNVIALCFDMDAAGQLAAQRGIREAMAMEMSIKVLALPGSKDPDECIKNNPDDWKQAVLDAKPMMEYYFEQIFDKLNLQSIDDKREGAQKALNIIVKLANKIEQGVWLKRLSEIIDVQENVLRETINNTKVTNITQNKPEKPSLPEHRELSSRENLLSELILALLIKFPQFIVYSSEHVSIDNIFGVEAKEFYKNLILYYNDISPDTNTGDIYNDFKNWIETNNNNVNQLKLLNKLVLLGDREFYEMGINEAQNEVIKTAGLLKKAYLNTRLKELERMISESERQGDIDKAQALMEELNMLSQELRSV